MGSTKLPAGLVYLLLLSASVIPPQATKAQDLPLSAQKDTIPHTLYIKSQVLLKNQDYVGHLMLSQAALNASIATLNFKILFLSTYDISIYESGVDTVAFKKRLASLRETYEQSSLTGLVRSQVSSTLQLAAALKALGFVKADNSHHNRSKELLLKLLNLVKTNEYEHLQAFICYELAELYGLLSDEIQESYFLNLAVKYASTYEDYFTEGKAKYYRANYIDYLESYQKALKTSQESIKAFGKLGLNYYKLDPFMLAAIEYQKLKNFNLALSYVDSAFQIITEYDIYSSIPDYLILKGQILYDLGRYDACRDLLLQELIARRKLNDRFHEARCLGDLGHIYKLLGDQEGALKHYKKAIEIWKSIGNTDKEVFNRLLLLTILAETGPYEELEEQVLRLERIISNRSDTSLDIYNEYDALKTLSRFFSTLQKPNHDPDKAELYMKNAYRLAKGSPNDEIDCLLRLSEIYGSLEVMNFQEALAVLERAETLSKENKDYRIDDIYTHMGRIYRALGDEDKKAVFLNKAIQIARTKNDTTMLIEALSSMITGSAIDSTFEAIVFEIDRLTQSPAYRSERLHNLERMANYYESKNNLDSAIAIRKNILTRRAQNEDFYGDLIVPQNQLLRLVPLIELLYKKEGYLTEEMLNYLEQADSLAAKASRNDLGETLIGGLANFYVYKLNNYRKAISLLSSFYDMRDSTYKGLSIIRSILGYAYEEIGEFGKAEDQYLLAVEADLKDRSYLGLASSYHSLASLHLRKTDYRQAIVFYEKILKLYESQSLLNVDRRYGRIVSELTQCYLAIGNYHKVRELSYRGLRLSPSVLDDKSVFYEYLIQVYNMYGLIDSSVYYEEMIINESTQPEKRIIASLLLWEWSRDSVSAEKYVNTIVNENLTDSSLKAIQLAFKNDPNVYGEFELLTSRLRRRESYIELATAFKFISIFYFAKSMSKDEEGITYAFVNGLENVLSPGYLELALQNVDSSMYYNSLAYQELKDPDERIAFTNQLSNVMPLFIGLTNAIHRQTNDPRHLIKAIDFLEQASARSFLQSMLKNKRTYEKSAFITSELDKIYRRISRINKRLTKTSVDTESEELIKERDKLLNEKRLLENYYVPISREEIDRSYYSPVQLATVINELSSNQVILRYFTNKDWSVAYLIDRDTVLAYELPPEPELAVSIKSIRNLYRSYASTSNENELATLKSASKSLFTTLVLPAFERIENKELMIIPDGILHYLPFEILLVADSIYHSKQGENRTEIRDQFLVNYCTISYTPSLSLYLRLRSAPDSYRRGSIAIFANSKFDTKKSDKETTQFVSRNIRTQLSSIDNLVYVIEEAKSISKLFSKTRPQLFPRSVRQQSVFLDEESSEGNLRESSLVRSSQYLHFATHALLDEENPELSALLLDEFNRPGSVEDGFLHAYEISNIELNADLVTLSACNTGLGKMYSGEGVVGLNRAFFAAGAHSLCLSLWAVDDRSTSVFMEHFYKLLNTVMDKATALTATKKYMLYETEFKSPYYWAPFILVGES